MPESTSHEAALSVHLPSMVGAGSLQYLTGKTKVSKCGWLGEWISSEITSWKQPPIQCVEKYSWAIFNHVHQPFAVSPVFYPFAWDPSHRIKIYDQWFIVFMVLWHWYTVYPEISLAASLPGHREWLHLQKNLKQRRGMDMHRQVQNNDLVLLVQHRGSMETVNCAWKLLGRGCRNSF